MCIRDRDYAMQNGDLVVGKGTELIKLETGQILLRFEDIINNGSLITTKNKYIAGDVWGIFKIFDGSEIKELEYFIQGIINSDSFLVRLNSPKRFAKIDSKYTI